MSDEHQHGIAPEPPEEPGHERGPRAGKHALPEYAVGDTGTRAVPIVPFDDEPHDAPAEDPARDPAYDPAYRDEHPAAHDAAAPVRGGRRAGPRRTRRGRSLPGCLAALVALVVVLALVWVGGTKGYHFLKDHMGASAADFAGPGSGSVTFQVHQGDSATVIANHLKADGVVASVQSFTDAARNDPDSGRIQVGYYRLKQKMRAADALKVLVDPKSLIQSVVVVPEGARVDQVVSAIATKTDIKKRDVTAALKNPQAIGLPAEANGLPEGYLFPATYTVVPGESAVDLIKQMVAKAVAEHNALHLDQAAAGVGLSPAQVVTVASILEGEVKRDTDYPKVARAIYNRLKVGMPLQVDSTVNYANDASANGEVWTSDAARQSDSPYNTYKHAGLPPGPIGNPGVATLTAALHPASGSWLYWTAVNLKTGETAFSTTLQEHNTAVKKLQEYCKTSSAC